MIQTMRRGSSGGILVPSALGGVAEAIGSEAMTAGRIRGSETMIEVARAWRRGLHTLVTGGGMTATTDVIDTEIVRVETGETAEIATGGTVVAGTIEISAPGMMTRHSAAAAAMVKTMAGLGMGEVRMPGMGVRVSRGPAMGLPQLRPESENQLIWDEEGECTYLLSASSR